MGNGIVNLQIFLGGIEISQDRINILDSAICILICCKKIQLIEVKL